MRTHLSSILPIVTAALIAVAPTSAEAQGAPSAAPRVVIAPELAPAVRVRTVARYDLLASRPLAGRERLPERITVADSVGTLVASFRLPGDRTDYPMLVVVMGPDLVLQGETPAGVLTLELLDANDPREGTRGTPTGRWHVDGQEGVLRGR